MPTDLASAPGSRKRRLLLGLGGASVLGGLAGWLGLGQHRKSSAAGGSASAAKSPLERSGPEPSNETPPAAESSTGSARPMTRDWFAPHVHSRFDIALGSAAPQSVELVEVSESTTLRAPAATYTAFSLLFIGPKTMLVESDVFQVSHPALGRCEVFLSPIGRNKKVEKLYLEAVFTQRV